MDFVVGLPKTWEGLMLFGKSKCPKLGRGLISSLFLLIRTTTMVINLVEQYVYKMVRLYGILKIISN